MAAGALPHLVPVARDRLWMLRSCRVQKVSDSDRDDMLAYNFDEEQELLKPLGAVAPHGEEGFSTLERIWWVLNCRCPTPRC